MAGKGRCRVGTSGWQYDHWRGPFYPPDLSKSRWFGHYAAHFDTVELNATFYRLPTQAVVDKWRLAAPGGFLYAVKASRFLTHIKRLRAGTQSLELFTERMAHLGDRLGPTLYQLPARFPRDEGLLSEFLKDLPPGSLAAFEFRDPSWFHQSVYDVLGKHEAALCLYDMEGFVSPLVDTAPFAYARLHGPAGRYQGSYSRQALAVWAERLGSMLERGLDAYCYFNNDQSGYAVANALDLLELLGR